MRPKGKPTPHAYQQIVTVPITNVPQTMPQQFPQNSYVMAPPPLLANQMALTTPVCLPPTLTTNTFLNQNAQHPMILLTPATPYPVALEKKRTAQIEEGFRSNAKRQKIEPISNALKDYKNSMNKGLREFSLKVSEKVKQKGTTTYTEVAEELISESLPAAQYLTTQQHSLEQKNVRRRVYDALNVLMAVNVIRRDKKTVRWVGIPTTEIQECKELQEEKARLVARIAEKEKELKKLALQKVVFHKLVERNRSESFSATAENENVVRLPYITVSTDNSTVIDCSISRDKKEYLFSFDRAFQIHDDLEVLLRLLEMNRENRETEVQKELDAMPATFPDLYNGVTVAPNPNRLNGFLDHLELNEDEALDWLSGSPILSTPTKSDGRS